MRMYNVHTKASQGSSTFKHMVGVAYTRKPMSLANMDRDNHMQ